MKLQVRLDRLLLGLRGLALLRGWPFEDSDDAEVHVRAIRESILRADELPMSDAVDVDDPGLGAAYAAWSKTYDTVPNALISAEEPVVRAILSELEPGPALDVACGTGRISALLSGFGHDVLGVDSSPEMLKMARTKGIRARLLRGDLHRLPIQDESVELVVCALALTHVVDLTDPLAEIARVVRPGGRVILSDVHPLAVATGAQAFFRAEDGSRVVARNHVHWPSAYVKAFTAAGLTVERCEEPLVDAEFVKELADPEIRSAAQASLLGLPLVLIWVLRK